jgi:phage/plasmid primase-like uncharacterized protein
MTATLSAAPDFAVDRSPGEHRIRCPFCESSDPDLSYRFDDDGAAGVYRCHHCGEAANWRERVNGSHRPPVTPRATNDPQAEAARRARAIWERSAPVADHRYLSRKDVASHGLRIMGESLTIAERDVRGSLIVPAYIGGEIATLQFVNADGAKLFLPRGRKSGASFRIGPEVTDRAIVCEGYATAESVYAATGIPTFVAFDKDNLRYVAKAIRAANPRARILIAGDDDRQRADNPGRAGARAAAEASGGVAVFPEFADDDRDGSDFNDLAARRGHGVVAEQITAAMNDAPETAATITPTTPTVYGIAQLRAIPAAVREWIVDGWLPAKVNAVLGGHGGAGKSKIAAMLAVCVAAGKPFYGMDVTQGPVLLYSCEDDVGEWVSRMRCAATHVGADFDALPIRFVDALDFDGDPALVGETQIDDDAVEFSITETGRWLGQQVDEFRAALVILDSGTDTFGGDENRRREVRRYLRIARRAYAHRACVLHILHVDKKAARGGAVDDLYSGVTDWNNGVRARLAFYRPRVDDDPDDAGNESDEMPMRLELQKSNYSRPGAYVDLRHDDDRRVFVPVGGSTVAASGDTVSAIRDRADGREILRLLAAAEDSGHPVHSSERATRNAFKRLSSEGTLPANFRGSAGKRRLFGLLLRFRHQGLLDESSVNRNRNRTSVWHVTPAGRAEFEA